MGEPKVCVLCHEPVVVGADASKWGMAWHGSDWVHLDCAENIGESARRVQGKPTIEALEREREDARRRTYCAFCGADYPLDSPETPALVVQHIFACEKHPIREIRQRLLNRVWANCTLGTAEELEAQALLGWIDECATLREAGDE